MKTAQGLFKGPFKQCSFITMPGMHILQRLRQATLLARFLLVGFVLSLSAAIASPLVNPQGLELICASNGVMKVLVKNADGSSTEVASRMLDCPMCATADAPPPTGWVLVRPTAVLLEDFDSAPVNAHTFRSAPPPARGPPTLT
jgi:hypothetical protein